MALFDTKNKDRQGVWLDRLIPGVLRADSGSLYRSRLFIGLFAFFVALGLLSFLGVKPLQSTTYPQLSSPTIFAASLAMYALIAYTFYGAHSLLWAVNAFMLAVMGVVFSVALLLLLKYHLLSFVLLPVPVVAFILGGAWSGAFWSFMMGALQLALSYLYVTGHHSGLDIGVVDPSRGVIANILIHGVTITMVIVSCFTYERIVSKLQSELEEEKIHFVHLANHDSLTGLPNRLAFENYTRKLMARALAAGDGFALIYIDLDNFKQVNDSFGHLVGDVVLKELANRMLGTVRKGDTVCRIGGDEFAIIMPQLHDSDMVVHRIDTLRRNLGRDIAINGESYLPGASFGYAFFPADADNFEDLLRCADAAMYRSKRGFVQPRLDECFVST